MANTTTAKSTVKVPEVDKISELEKENKEIKEKLEKLMALLEASEKKSEQPVCVSEKTLVEDGPDMPEEPSPNKTIRILSLCRGYLNLSEDESGKVQVNFSKYGEIKTVLYSSLINIVNYNRNFAEKGVFYILDESAVYYLGLKDFYSKLVTNDVLDNICTYEDVDIIKLIDGTEKRQIDTMVKNLIDRLYAGENLDLNKIQVISKKTGTDIMSKVNEMKNFDGLK